jgi:hypothetical protein
MGCGYGSCDNCTPQYVKDAEKRLYSVRNDAEESMLKHFAKEIKELEKMKKDWIEERIKSDQDAFDILYKQGKNWIKEKV